jgi:hypothetical protein
MARRKVRHHIVTAGVGDDGARERGVDLRHCDCYAWKHGAAFVGHTAVELRRRLCPALPADRKTMTGIDTSRRKRLIRILLMMGAGTEAYGRSISHT